MAATCGVAGVTVGGIDAPDLPRPRFALSVSLGPYDILDVLGEGAFGGVFVGRLRGDPLRRRVALKVLKPEYAANAKVLQRFRDEARLLSRLRHPNIVRVEQLLEIESRPVVVMECVEGVSLRNLLMRSPRGLPASVAMEVMRRTALALDAAWEQPGEGGAGELRVVHRDIKPSNLLLSVRGELRVVDFGIATGRFEGREAATQSLVLGSRPYMAPERLDGAPDGPAVDIYSAGVTLFELLVGQVPELSVKPGRHERALKEQVVHVRAPGLDARSAEDLRSLITRMCAYDVDVRPRARDVAAELGRLNGDLAPDHRVGLEAYAMEHVRQLLDERTKASDARIHEVLSDRPDRGDAGSLTSNGRRRGRSFRLLHPRTAMFFGAMAGMVLGLGGLAANKAMRPTPTPTEVLDHGVRKVKLVFPDGVVARMGSETLFAPGHVQAPARYTHLELSSDDGMVWRCGFDAQQGDVVRYVLERGQVGLSIDDGPFIPCEAEAEP